MATLRDAERARDEASALLVRLGAHAISVEEEPIGEGTAGPALAAGTSPDGRLETLPGLSAATPETPLPGISAAGGVRPRDPRRPGSPLRRRRDFAVVAWFADEPPAELPARVVVRAGRRTASVPVRARRAEPFAPEEAVEHRVEPTPVRGPGDIPGPAPGRASGPGPHPRPTESAPDDGGGDPCASC